MKSREFEIFINHNNPSVTDKITRYMTIKEGGLGMIKINTFWRAIRMSWLRRLSSSKSTWAKLHTAETKPFTYSPDNTNMEKLMKARNLTKNRVWRDIYDSLATCRNNIVFRNPSEYLSIPINGESLITRNRTPINQLWCEQLMIKDIF